MSEKKISFNLTQFEHSLYGTSVKLTEGSEKDKYILSVVEGKLQQTTTLTKADLLQLVEFLQMKGIL